MSKQAELFRPPPKPKRKPSAKQQRARAERQFHEKFRRLITKGKPDER